MFNDSSILGSQSDFFYFGGKNRIQSGFCVKVFRLNILVLSSLRCLCQNILEYLFITRVLKRKWKQHHFPYQLSHRYHDRISLFPRKNEKRAYLVKMTSMALNSSRRYFRLISCGKPLLEPVDNVTIEEISCFRNLSVISLYKCTVGMDRLFCSRKEVGH